MFNTSNRSLSIMLGSDSERNCSSTIDQIRLSYTCKCAGLRQQFKNNDKVRFLRVAGPYCSNLTIFNTLTTELASPIKKPNLQPSFMTKEQKQIVSNWLNYNRASRKYNNERIFDVREAMETLALSANVNCANFDDTR